MTAGQSVEKGPQIAVDHHLDDRGTIIKSRFLNGDDGYKTTRIRKEAASSI
jgi:hypothetical protein